MGLSSIAVAIGLLVSVAYANDTAPAVVPDSTTSGVKASVQHRSCTTPSGAVDGWYYNSRSLFVYDCYDPPNGKDWPWAMLKAYREGGQEGVHWKYTDDPNDKECLSNWIYWSADSSKSLAVVSGRTTFVNSSRRWCALPVYRSGGAQGKLWQNCACVFDDPIWP